MSKYHIPIIAEVEASSMDEARQFAYENIEKFKSEKMTAIFGNDDRQMKDGQRVFILHPPDVSADEFEQSQPVKEG